MDRERVVGGSPWTPGSDKAVRKRGSPPTVRTVNPHSRSGTRSPHLQGRVMDHLFVGLDVAKDHLDVHCRPSGDAFVVPHDEAGLTELVARLRALRPTLVVLEATGGYEATVAATLACASL